MTDEPLVLDNLTEEEAYLYAILSDPSGLDQAEFLWVDESSDDNRFCPHCGTERDGVHTRAHSELQDEDWVEKYSTPSACFRAWAFQWPWWRSTAPQSVDQCARSVGKSLSVKMRSCAFPFLYPGQEMVITAPELIHLEPITGLVENQMNSTRFLREMLPKGKSAVTHRPFLMNFLNGARIIGRIPQRDGRGLKGVHPVWLEVDEAQDMPHAAWVEVNETVKKGVDGWRWKVHGVTKGVRDDFYRITQDVPGNSWHVHRYAAMWRPSWTSREREQAVERYGSREDPDYRRNVLGLHGDKTNPIFVLTSLMKCVDTDELSSYNTEEYFKVATKSEQLELFGQEMIDLLDFPRSHLAYAGQTESERIHRPKAVFWAGMDIGFTVDPSEIIVCVEHRPKPSSPKTVLKTLTRISMTRMPHHEQLKTILHVIDFYRPKAFSMDKTGLGLPLYQELQEYVAAYRQGDDSHLPPWAVAYDLENALTRIKGYNFSEKLLVDLDQSVEFDEFDDHATQVSKAGLKRNAKEFATDFLRELVDDQRLELPWDDDLLKQFQGGTWTSSRSMDAYGRRVFSRGNDHVLDAFRMLVTGFALHQIEELTRSTTSEPVFDAFVML